MNFKTFLKISLLLQSELIFIQIVVDNSIVKFFYLGQWVSLSTIFAEPNLGYTS